MNTVDINDSNNNLPDKNNAELKEYQDNTTNKVKLTGTGGKNNFNSYMKGLIQNDAQREIAKKLLTETLEAYTMPKVTNEEELIQRLNDYFKRCAQQAIIPTVEEMCLYTGHSVKYIWDIEAERSHALGANASEIIKKAKSFMQSFDAKLVTSGQLNFLTYCFRAKNYYGMVDKSEVVLTPNSPFGNADPVTLAEKYKDAIPQIEGKTVEKE